MERLKKVQAKLYQIMTTSTIKPEERDINITFEMLHSASAAQLAKILASEREVDVELAAITCALHDIGRILTGNNKDHALVGYEPAKKLLNEIEDFTIEEIEQIGLAIKRHSNKTEIGSGLEELVKDIDIMDCYLYGLVKDHPAHNRRLQIVKNELGIY